MKDKKSGSDDSSHHSEIHELLEIVEFLMATVKDINTKLDAISVDVDRVAGLIKGAGVATQAELDAIDAAAKAIQDKVAAIKSPGTGTGPMAPTVTASADANHFVNLSWGVITGAATYNIKRGDTAGSEVLLQGIASPSTKAQDATTVAGKTYFYKVSSVDASNVEGPDSVEVSVTA